MKIVNYEMVVTSAPSIFKLQLHKCSSVNGWLIFHIVYHDIKGQLLKFHFYTHTNSKNWKLLEYFNNEILNVNGRTVENNRIYVVVYLYVSQSKICWGVEK